MASPDSHAAPAPILGRRALARGAIVRIERGVLYDMVALAAVFDITPAAVKTRRRRHQLPPAVRVGRRLMWEGGALLDWLFPNGDGAAPRTPAPPPAGRRRRPVLSPDDVVEIRAELTRGVTQASLARRFGVTPGQISHIATARSWRQLGGSS